MLLAAAAVAMLGLEQYGVTTVGAILRAARPAAAERHRLRPDPSAASAIGITIVGYTDNVLTARAFAGRRRETVDSNTELMTLGAANLAAGALQGFPVSSSGSRTALADTVGARRPRLYSLVALGTVW